MYKKKKVLIIDDEIDLGQLLKGYFNRKNFEVFVFHSLADGLSTLKSIQPDIILIDNNFPDGSGWNAVPAIMQEHPNIHIALISAFNAPLPQTLLNKKVYILEKPIQLTDLDNYLSKIEA